MPDTRATLARGEGGGGGEGGRGKQGKGRQRCPQQPHTDFKDFETEGVTFLLVPGVPRTLTSEPGLPAVFLVRLAYICLYDILLFRALKRP